VERVDPGVSDDEPLELTADERAALITLLRQTLDYARFPMGASPRPAEGDPAEARAAKTAVRSAAAVATRHGPEPRARETTTVNSS